jgi:hypothetical protein
VAYSPFFKSSEVVYFIYIPFCYLVSINVNLSLFYIKKQNESKKCHKTHVPNKNLKKFLLVHPIELPPIIFV